MESKHLSKLFGVLVLGGAMMAQADDTTDILTDLKPAELCQVEVVTTTYVMGQDPVKSSTCVDQKTEEEIAELIKEAKENSCFSPFCGCWLG